MKKFNYLLYVFVTYLGFCGVVSAAGVSISSSANSVQVGNTFSVTVNASGAEGWTYCISYDSSMLTLQSSTIGDSDGNLNCLLAGASTKASTKSVKFTFKSIKSGATSVSVRDLGMVDYLGEPVEATAGSVSISSKTKEEIQASYSSNANLKSLSIQGFEMSPAFNKDTLNYKLDVDNDVESVVINATKEDGTAVMSGVGTRRITEGVNKLVVKVTAQKGNTKSYTIVVTRKELNPINVKVDGKEYSIVRKASDLEAPDLFVSASTNYGDDTIPAFTNEITKLVLVGLKDSEGNIGLYIYNEKDKSFKEFKEYSSQAVTIISVLTDEKVAGYDTEKEIEVNGVKGNVFVKNKDDKLVLIYGMNLATGESNWYTYDINEGSFQRYYTDEIVLADEEEQKDNVDKTYFYATIGFAGVSFLAILLIIVLMVVNRKVRKKNKKLISIIEHRDGIFEKNSKEEKKKEKKKVSKEEKKLIDNIVKSNENTQNNDDIEIEDEIEKDAKSGFEEFEKMIDNETTRDFELTQIVDFDDDTTSNTIIDDITLEQEIIEEDEVPSKRDLKRMAKQEKREHKKALARAKKEFLDDVDFGEDGAFDKYVREETEIIPVIKEEKKKKERKKREKKSKK